MRKPQVRVGDWVRILGLPVWYGKPASLLHPDTKRVFMRLAARGRPQRVYKIEPGGYPWIRCRFRRKNGSWESHFLGLYPSEGKWSVVRKRPS